jgi:hypothetical protein
MGHAEDGMKEGDYDDDQVDLAEEVETKPPGDHVSHEGNILTSPIQYWYLANLIMGKLAKQIQAYRYLSILLDLVRVHNHTDLGRRRREAWLTGWPCHRNSSR